MKRRERNLVVRLHDDEHAMIRALAENTDDTAARLVRRFIRDAYVERFGVKAPPTQKK